MHEEGVAAWRALGKALPGGSAELGMEALPGCMASQGAGEARMFRETPPEVLVIGAQLPEDGWGLSLAVLPASTTKF